MSFEEKVFCVYIMSNWKRGVLYVGVTGNLINRVTEHREGAIGGFTKRYQLKRLVWYRAYGAAIDASGSSGWSRKRTRSGMICGPG
jgi:putative endonuclease